MSIVDNYIQASNAHDVDAIVNTFSEDGVYLDPVTAQEVSGETLFGYLSGLFTAFPDLRYEIISMIESGDHAIFEWIMRGTNTGEGAGHPATGREIAMRGVDVMTLKSGRIERANVYFDKADYAEQLGLMEAQEEAEEGIV